MNKKEKTEKTCKYCTECYINGYDDLIRRCNHYRGFYHWEIYDCRFFKKTSDRELEARKYWIEHFS